MNGFIVCGSYLELLDLIPGLPIYAFYDCRAPNHGKDVGGSVDRDVTMSVNVISPTFQQCRF